jgi:hypothetical protein
MATIPKRRPKNPSEFKHAVAVSAALGVLCFGVALVAAHFVGG